MKTNFFKIAALALVVSAVATSCSEEKKQQLPIILPTGPYTALTEAELSGVEFGVSFSNSDIAAPDWAKESWAKSDGSVITDFDVAKTEIPAMASNKITLAANTSYKLTESLTIEDGETLVIESGVKIFAEPKDNALVYIMICQGGKIEAEGTEDAPIIMTSAKKAPGSWGGVHICGKAKMNNGTTGKSEIGDKVFGGSDDADNSGTMKYIRIEYAGLQLDPETEANGFTFYAVGNGTTVENCCAYEGADDGFEFFGGAVECEKLVSINNQDDSFDWTYGFTGAIAGAYALQTNAKCDHLIEGDSNKSDSYVTPISCPTITDAVLVGMDSDGDRGVRLRRGSRIVMDNVLISGKTNSFDLISEATVKYFRATPDAFKDVEVDGELTNTEL